MLELHNCVHITQKVNRALIGIYRELVKVQFASYLIGTVGEELVKEIGFELAI